MSKSEKITGKDIKLMIWGIIGGAVLSPLVLAFLRILLESPTVLGKILRKAAYDTASNINDNSSNTVTFIVFLILTFFFIIGLIETVNDSKREAQKFEIYKKQYEEIEEKTPKQISEYEYRERKWKSTKGQYKQILPLMIMIELLFLGVAFVNIKANKLYDQFIKDSETIAPYISDQELKILKSQWRQMKQEEDHQKIVQYIDSAYTANKLPKPDRDR